MCQAVIYRYQNNSYRVSSNDQKAKLPILLKTGASILLPWGRHRLTVSQLPTKKWIALNQIQSGLWDAYFPKAVKLPIQSFLVQDTHKKSQWFHLPPDKWIQGLVARFQQDFRVYIVTLDPCPSNPYPLWPRILLG